MQNKIVMLSAAVAAGFVLGVRAARPRSKRPPETLRHQAERLWNDPKARRNRKRKAKQIKQDVGRAAKRATKRARKTGKTIRR